MKDLLVEVIDYSNYNKERVDKETVAFKELFEEYYIIVTEGLVAVEYYNNYGEGSMLHFYLPYSVLLGFNYTLFKQNKDVNLVALTDLEIIKIPKERYKSKVENSEFIKHSHIRESKLLIGVNNRLYLKNNISYTAYVLYVLLSIAPYINKISKVHLAKLLGCSRSTLYETLKKLKELKLISFEREIEIDESASKKYLEPYLCDYII